MRISLSDHFTYNRLIRFVLPSIGMVVFNSIYSVVDGFFISNYTGEGQFAAVNIIFPFIMMMAALGFMIGTGGTALVSYYQGLKDDRKARSVFSLLVYLVIIIGTIITVVAELILPDVAVLLGAEGELIDYCVEYGRILIFALVPFMLQNMFQSFLVAAEKPKLGFIVTVLSGVTNMVFDAVLVAMLGRGLTGASIATAMSAAVGGVIPLIYFIAPNGSRLRLGKADIDFKAIAKACSNGASEFLTNISLNIVAILYNIQLLKYLGEKGVAAYGVIMYVCFVFIAIFLGYSVGTAPIVSYNYGADNSAELKNLFGKSLKLLTIFSIAMFVLAEVLTVPFAKMYVGYDEELMELTVHAMRVYSISFVVLGFNIYGSSFFTAVNYGVVSAVLSVLRTLIIQIIVILTLPIIMGVEGIWWATNIAEAIAFGITIFCWIKYRKRYKY